MIHKRGFFQKEQSWLVFLLIFGLIFIRFCYYGFTYFPQLDDYIQLHNYSAYFSFQQVVLDMDLLTARPLAALGDYFVWGQFWGMLMVGAAVISALYAASACLFRAVWGKYFGTGYLFLVVYALLPLGMEGSYWISASNRVVPSLFFTALAMWLFQRWCVDGKWYMVCLFFVTQLVSFGFYEQGLVLSVTGTFLVALLEFRVELKRSLFSLLTFVNVALYFLITKSFDTGYALMTGRMKLILPWQEGWDAVFESAGRQVGASFVKGGWNTTVTGFRRGLETIFSDFNFLWVLAVLALCALLFLAARKYTGESTRAPGALIVGFLMALAPVTIFFILANPAFGLRNTVFSFCGVALMADALLGLILRGTSKRGVITGGVCAVLALVFCVAAASELKDYRQTYLDDQRAASAVSEALDGGYDVPMGTKIAVVGLQGSYLTEQNFAYHEHIHGATESDWAFTGLLSCVSGNPGFPYTIPIPDAQGADLSQYGMVLLYDHESGTATLKE